VIAATQQLVMICCARVTATKRPREVDIGAAVS
jgi:hypothetical protein